MLLLKAFLLLFVWEATSNTPQKGRGKQEEKWSQTASCTCFVTEDVPVSHLLANFSPCHLQSSNNPKIFAKVDSVQFPSFSKVRSSQTPQSRSWKLSLHLTFQPTSWCLGVYSWATSLPKISLSSLTHPIPRLDIQWNLYFTDPRLVDGDD